MPLPRPMNAEIDSSVDLKPFFSAASSNPKDVAHIIASLSPQHCAQIAKFFYGKVHMRELGLRLAARCQLVHLRNVFGAGAETVYRQSRDVSNTLASLQRDNRSHEQKSVSLKLINFDHE